MFERGEKMKVNLKTFLVFLDELLIERPDLLSEGAYNLIKEKLKECEAELIDKVKRTKDTISMGEKLLTADILGMDYPTFFKEILGDD